MKNKVIIILCLILGMSLSFISVSLSKYIFKVSGKVSITTEEFYFESNASDLTIPIQSPSFTIEIDNYIGSEYTKDDIEYKISISDGNGVNDNYNFSINNGSFSTADYYTRTLSGGKQTKDTLLITLDKLVSSNVVEEDIYFTIEALEPYNKKIEFVVTVINPPGFEVIGNPTDWTKDPVTLTIVPNNASNVSAYSFDDGLTWQSTPSKTYSDNEDNIKIKIKDNYNNETDSVTINITKIDTKNPNISFNNSPLVVTLDEDTTFTSLISVSDSLSGVNDAGLVVKRGKTIIDNTNYFTSPGLYAISLSVTDNVGNENSMDTTLLVRWPTGGKYVVKRTEIVGTGKAVDEDKSGLYKDTSETGFDDLIDYSSKYYYSGPNVNNNYVTFAGYTYQILNIANNDDIKLISDISSRNVRYSNRKIFESGSYADADDWNTWWNGKYMYYTNDDNYRTLTDTDMSHIAEATFYAGRFTKEATPTLFDTVQQERTGAINIGADSAAFQSHFSFPNVSDYIKACNRMNTIYNITTVQANTSLFKTCSYLQTNDEQWTINSKNDTATDNDFWVLDPTIAGNNRIVSRTYYYYENYRPVFYLKEDTILSGTGTELDPFIVHEDWSWFDNNQTLQ